MKQIVSIIIPTYNRASFLGETLDSVLIQTYEPWECIVVDDGSTDYTPELMKFYCEKSPRIKYYRRPKKLLKGANSCRNYGFKLSKGNFIMWLDDDDLLHKEKLKKQVEVSSNHKDCLITCSWGRYSGKDTFHYKDLKIYKDYQDPVNLFQEYGDHGFFPPHVFLVPRNLIEKAGLWHTNLKVNQDAEFFSRIIIKAACIKFAAGTHVKYREHFDNRTSFINSVQKAEGLVKSWSLIEKNINENKKGQVKKYIVFGRSHAYSLLKQGGFKGIIFLNLFIFRGLIISDLFKKYKLLFHGPG